MNNILDIRDVAVLRGGTEILRSVSLAIPEGKFVSIIGPNGSGKTTLMNVIARLLVPNAGSVSLMGREIRRYGRREYARIVAVVSQDEAGAFAFTVRDMVGLGYYPHRKGLFFLDTDEELIDRTLERCGITSLAERDVRTLSGGEFQRVTIARALVQQPKILILDEPTSHLDIRHQIGALNLIKELLPDLTVIAVLHDLNLAAYYADLIGVLHQGTIRTFGRPEEVLTAALVQEVFGVSAEVRTYPVTGKPMIMPWYVEQQQIPSALSIHLISGGGTGSPLIPLLRSAGCSLSCGVLAENDTDYQTAVSQDINIISEPAFTPISEKSYYLLMERVDTADGVIIAEMPIGIGNLPNIRSLGRVHPERIGILGRPEKWQERDHTDGEATALLSAMVSKGAWILDDEAGITAFLTHLADIRDAARPGEHS